jgi:hypothetical protein
LFPQLEHLIVGKKPISIFMAIVYFRPDGHGNCGITPAASLGPIGEVQNLIKKELDFLEEVDLK